jgi:hypothetical protein
MFANIHYCGALFVDGWGNPSSLSSDLIFIPLNLFFMLLAIYFQMIRFGFKSIFEKTFFVLIMFLLLSSNIIAYASVYRRLGLIDLDQPSNNPITCLYFSIVTWTTLGYGDVRPSLDARLVAAFEALTGYFVMAVYISLFATFFASTLSFGGSRSTSSKKT